MKNALNYFYNIVINDIHQNDKMFYFEYGGYKYALLTYNGDINLLTDIYNLHLEAFRQGLYVHQIILNKDGQIATLINDTPYILMRIFYEDGDVDLDSLLPFMNTTYSTKFDFNRSDWGTLWSDKIDYLEYEISQIGGKYPMIRETFSYFIGLGETAIQLVNMVNNENNDKISLKSIGHNRIKKGDTLFELYNPLNLVVDFRVRDMAEYFKYHFFAGDNIDDDIQYFFKYFNLTTEEYLLFLARMLYPTYYFDVYEDIISGKGSEEDLKKIVNLVNDYENLIKNIYTYLKSYLPMVRIEWLEIN